MHNPYQDSQYKLCYFIFPWFVSWLYTHEWRNRVIRIHMSLDTLCDTYIYELRYVRDDQPLNYFFFK